MDNFGYDEEGRSANFVDRKGTWANFADEHSFLATFLVLMGIGIFWSLVNGQDPFAVLEAFLSQGS